MSESQDEKDKLCIVTWDEVNLMQHVQHDKSSDQIAGLEDWGYKRTYKFADHAIVFLLRNIRSGWILPVHYCFCQSLTRVADLKKCIKKVIEAVEATGFHIVASVCDQASTNKRAVDELIAESNKIRRKNNEPESESKSLCPLACIYVLCAFSFSGRTIKVGHCDIIPLYDPSHIIKGTRNNLLTKLLEMNIGSKGPRKFAYWSVVEKAFKIDQRSHGLHPKMKKLTEEHINPKKKKKVRVKHAVQVLSRSVASCIRDFTERGE